MIMKMYKAIQYINMNEIWDNNEEENNVWCERRAI